MNSGLLPLGSSPEELDKLIQSFEFENQHIVKFIEKENQLMEALQTEITEKKEATLQFQESTSQLDEETKRAHKQFIQNRDNCESLRKTASVLLDHEVALMKKMNTLVLHGEQERTDRQKVLKHYGSIWEDYKAKYESFPLAKICEEKKRQLGVSAAKLVEASQKMEELKKTIATMRGSEVDVYDMKKFLVSVAELKLDTDKRSSRLHVMSAEKRRIEDALQGIEENRQRAEEAARACKLKRQQELAEAQAAQEKEAREQEAREKEAKVKEARELEARKIAEAMLSGGQSAGGQSSQSRGTLLTPVPEQSTLSHMYGKGNSPLSATPAVKGRPSPQFVRPVYGQAPRPQHLTQLYHTNRAPAGVGGAAPRRPQLNIDIMKYSFTSGVGAAQSQGVENSQFSRQQQPAQPQIPSYVIQAPRQATSSSQVIASYNRTGPMASQPNPPRQPVSKPAAPTPTFKHPNQLDSFPARASPPQSAHSSMGPTTGTRPQSVSVMSQFDGSSEMESQRTQPHPLTLRPESVVRGIRAGMVQEQITPMSTPYSPLIPPLTATPGPQLNANQQSPLPPTPQTPARPIMCQSQPRTPEHQEVSTTQPTTPGEAPPPGNVKSPFDLEKHLERVRLLTKSPVAPQFSTRPMFGSEQTGPSMECPPSLQTSASEREQTEPQVDNPFIQSFFPDGRGDGSTFQRSFHSPVIREASGKSLFGVNSNSPALGGVGGEGVAFDFSGGSDTPQPPASMFSLFGEEGGTPVQGTATSTNDFSFNFGSPNITSPQVSQSGGFSLF